MIKMYKVRISTQDSREMLLRQTPESSGRWGNYQFYINEDIDEADFWVVYGKGRCMNERCHISRENLIFGSGEPDSVYRYSDKFIKQFNTVFAASQAIKHPNKIVCQPALAWYIGVSFKSDNHSTVGQRVINPNSDYDYFKQHLPLNKSKLMSVICSNLRITKGHQERVDFVEKLKSKYGDQIDIYGRGFNPIDDKWDALRDYKYHIVIENTRCEHYWSEKFADAILGGCYPIYYGCPNMSDYFPEGSYTPIDLHDFEQATKIIDDVIEKDYAEKNKVKLIEAQDLLLDKYNFFNVVANICDGLNPNAPKENILLRHELGYKNWNKVATLLKRYYYKYLYIR